MKIKTILAAVAVAVAAFAFSSCNKSDTGADAGGYYLEPTASATGANSTFVMLCTTELRNAFGNDIVYKNSSNDSKAIAACDKVFNEKKQDISISFELCFKTAVGEGEKTKRTVIKTYKPAN